LYQIQRDSRQIACESRKDSELAKTQPDRDDLTRARALIIGCGYLGRRVAALWRSQGHQVSALTRSPDRADVFRNLGLDPIVGDVLERGTLHALPAADVVLYAVGHDRSQAVSKRDVYLNGLRNTLLELAPRIKRFLYVSSTSVYGQNAGEWVDETSPCVPTKEDGQICLAAEQIVWEFFPAQRLPSEPGAVVLRFSGIYGPGRLIRRVESIRSGEPIQANPDGFMNLIHVDDGARIVTELAARGSVGTTYVVTDNEPVRRREYYSLLANLIGGPAPTFSTADSAELNKRCGNACLRGELGDIFQFPSIATGLPHALAEPR
jgi:nucleoside-diphosphate-sugar epimerase